MAIAMLWLECLALALVFSALIYAVSGRMQSRFWRFVLRLATFAFQALLGVIFILLGWEMRNKGIEPSSFFLYALSGTLFILFGFVLIRRFAIAKEKDAEACRFWPRWALTGALGILLAFFSITVLFMDMDARARLASAQARALAQAIRINPGPVPKNQNAALVYEELAAKISLPKWAYDIAEPGFIPDSDKVREILEKNQGAFPLLDRAAILPDASVLPDIGLDREWPGFRAPFPNTSGVRDSVRLLALDAYVRALRGETEFSLKRINEMGAAARHISRTPYLITTLVAGSIIQDQKSALERMLALSPEMNPSLISLPVESERYLTTQWRRSLAMEDAMLMYSFASDFLSDRIKEFWLDLSITDIFLLNVLPYRALVSKYDLAYFENFWHKTHAYAHRPIYEAYLKQKDWEQDIKKKPGGFFAAFSPIPRISRYFIPPNIAEAHQGLMDLGLAAFAYHAKNGRYPRRLDELVPAYIQEVPVDPFDGRPLKMVALSGGTVFYSIGPDFKDNGGRVEYELPYDDNKSGDILFRLGSAYDETFLKPALVQLAADGNLNLVKRALTAGADVDQDAPIVAAAANGHIEVVRLLFEKGADINALAGAAKKSKRRGGPSRRRTAQTPGEKIGGWSALMAAALNGHGQTVRLLVDRGADPNAANASGRTALMLASGIGLVEATEWAVREMKVLDGAKKKLQVLEDKVKHLEAEAKGFFKKEAAQKQLAQAQAQLLQTRRTIQTLEKETPPLKKAGLGVSFSSENSKRVDLARQLLAAGADVNTKDAFGTTALLSAVFEGHSETVRMLVQNGADINAANEMGWTPLVIAKVKGFRDMEKFLEESGAVFSENETKVTGRLANALERLKNKPKRRR